MKPKRLPFFPSAAFCIALPSGGSTTQKSSSATGKNFNAVAHRPNNQSNARVKGSVKDRMVYVMEGNRPLRVTPTAMEKPGHETPLGHFRVQKNIANKRSYSSMISSWVFTPPTDPLFVG